MLILGGWQGEELVVSLVDMGMKADLVLSHFVSPSVTSFSILYM